MNRFVLHARKRVLAQNDRGHAVWNRTENEKLMDPGQTALLLCDVWDSHWCRGARERLDAMIPRMNRVVAGCRASGIQIIHAPSDTMGFYEGTPARNRIVALADCELPEPVDHEDPPLPVDASDGGSDTGESCSHRAWKRQQPGIEIDQERDAISDNGREIYMLMRSKGIDTLIIMGVHTNMCILNRSFAVKAMVKWQVDVYLVRDLTDAMYNPAKPPYVSHEQGTRLVVEFIEKFWCPSISSRDLVKD